MDRHRNNEKIKLFNREGLLKLLMLLAVAAVVVYFFPAPGKFRYEYAVGKPWEYSLLTAPFDIPIELDEAQKAAKRDSVDQAFVRVYSHNIRIADDQARRLNEKLATTSLPYQLRAAIGKALRQVYSDGIVDNSTFDLILKGKAPVIRYNIDNELVEVETYQMRSVKSAYAVIDSLVPEIGQLSSDLRIVDYLKPNITIDTVLNDKLLNEAYLRATAPNGMVQKNEKIIDRGERVSPQTFNILQSYEARVNEMYHSTSKSHYPILGQLVIVLLLLASIYVFLALFRWRFFGDLRKMVFLMLLITVFTLAAFLLKGTFGFSAYVIPFALIAIMITSLFDSRTAMFVFLVELLLCALALNLTLQFVFLQMVAGVTAVFSLRELTRRSQLFRCAIFVFVAYCVTYTAMVVASTGSINAVGYHAYMYFLVNCGFLLFCYVLIWAAEKGFGFISPVTLVELTDTSNPLLKRLSEAAPGTFQHSLQVANIASEAAKRIGADELLVRAGALYHDVGKIENPNFFTENQAGVNPHETLSPEVSASIVIRHVTDGLKLAEKAKVPQLVRDFIPQHHGRGRASYFYTMACNAVADPATIDPMKFTYPGPNPLTKEAAILMLADSVEAASRSLKSYDTESLTALVNRIAESKIKEGLLNDCALSFRDLKLVKDSMVERLKIIYHGRISYPTAPGDDSEEITEGNPNAHRNPDAR